MENNNEGVPQGNYKRRGMNGHGAGSGIYGLGFIGSAIYYLQHSATFWAGVFGILKALVWPALLVYKLLEFLKM